MAVPPDVMQALMASGGMMPPGAEMAAAMPPAPLEEEAPPSEGGLYGASGGDNMEALRVALDALKAYAEEEDDDQHIQVVLKCITALQGILAEEQKMADGLMGGKLDPRALRRVASASQGEPTY